MASATTVPKFPACPFLPPLSLISVSPVSCFTFRFLWFCGIFLPSSTPCLCFLFFYLDIYVCLLCLRRLVIQSRGCMVKVTLEHIITSERPKRKKKEIWKNLTPPSHPSFLPLSISLSPCCLPHSLVFINPIFLKKVCPCLTPSPTIFLTYDL